MTQEAFATRLGVTPQAVSRWERGNGLPDVTMLQGICEVLHINANELLGLAGWEMVENHDSSMAQEIRETDRDADAGDKDPGQYQPAGTWNANQSI